MHIRFIGNSKLLVVVGESGCFSRLCDLRMDLLCVQGVSCLSQSHCLRWTPAFATQKEQQGKKIDGWNMLCTTAQRLVITKEENTHYTGWY